MLERITLNDFQAHVGSSFTMQVGDEAVELTLVEAEAKGEAAREGGREPFSLLYRGPRGFVTEQRIYRLEHPSLGAMELFVVPIQPDVEGSLFEVVFT